MSLLEAIVLGLTQGLTEFLPISSTAHLRIIPAFAGWEDPGAAFTAVTQLGTMAAVLLYFREDLGRIARAWARSLRRPELRRELDARIGWYIVLGVVLLLAERVGRRDRGFEEIRTRDGFAIGLAQALALVPGVSRSGATITAGLFMGLDRTAAARFSFLLSVPAVVLSGLLELGSLIRGEEGETTTALGLVVATLLAFVSGYASIALLLRFLSTHSTRVFVAYRVALGALVLVLVSAGTID